MSFFGLFSDDTKKVTKPKGYSVSFGLNSVDPRHYDGWSGELRACENDAKFMAHMLTQKGFLAQTFLTKAATTQNFFDALGKLAHVAKAGDIVVVSNSSHGGQVPDYDGDEVDGMDETICLYDRQVLDDELLAVWATFAAGVRIVFVSDSCHSGTMVRAFGQSSVLLAQDSKALPPDVAIQTAAANQGLYRAVAESVKKRDEIEAHVLAYGACQDNQTASDGSVNGAFTGALLATLTSYPGDNYGRIMTRTKRAMLPSQTPKYTYFGPRLDSFEKSAAFSV